MNETSSSNTLLGSPYMDLPKLLLLVRLYSRHCHHDIRGSSVGKQDKKIHWRYFEYLFFNDCCFLADSMGGPWSHCYALGFFQQKGHLIGISGIILPPVLRLKYSDSIHSFIQCSLDHWIYKNIDCIVS